MRNLVAYLFNRQRKLVFGHFSETKMSRFQRASGTVVYALKSAGALKHAIGGPQILDADPSADKLITTTPPMSHAEKPFGTISSEDDDRLDMLMNLGAYPEGQEKIEIVANPLSNRTQKTETRVKPLNKKGKTSKLEKIKIKPRNSDSKYIVYHDDDHLAASPPQKVLKSAHIPIKILSSSAQNIVKKPRKSRKAINDLKVKDIPNIIKVLGDHTAVTDQIHKSNDTSKERKEFRKNETAIPLKEITAFQQNIKKRPKKQLEVTVSADTPLHGQENNDAHASKTDIMNSNVLKTKLDGRRWSSSSSIKILEKRKVEAIQVAEDHTSRSNFNSDQIIMKNGKRRLSRSSYEKFFQYSSGKESLEEDTADIISTSVFDAEKSLFLEKIADIDSISVSAFKKNLLLENMALSNSSPIHAAEKCVFLEKANVNSNPISAAETIENNMCIPVVKNTGSIKKRIKKSNITVSTSSVEIAFKPKKIQRPKLHQQIIESSASDAAKITEDSKVIVPLIEEIFFNLDSEHAAIEIALDDFDLSIVHSAEKDLIPEARRNLSIGAAKNTSIDLSNTRGDLVNLKKRRESKQVKSVSGISIGKSKWVSEKTGVDLLIHGLPKTPSGEQDGEGDEYSLEFDDELTRGRGSFCDMKSRVSLNTPRSGVVSGGFEDDGVSVTQEIDDLLF